LYHVLNRGNGRQDLFHKPADFRAYLGVLAEGLKRYPVELLCYCLMDNHWHLVLRPRKADALGRLMGWVGVTHVRRHHEHYHSRGGGHLYQGRFKSFPVQDDRHFLTVCRYVESNALRAKLVRRAEHWEFCSLWRRMRMREAIKAKEALDGDRGGDAVEGVVRDAGKVVGDAAGVKRDVPALELMEWPVARPGDWLERVNRAMKETELDRLRTSVNRGRPFGGSQWERRTAKLLGLEHTFRDAGRPRKADVKERSLKAGLRNQ
jgi:putative transposase